MLLYPDVQARGREELDRAVGSARLPEFQDRDSLPYTTAILKELLRHVLNFLNSQRSS